MASPCLRGPAGSQVLVGSVGVDGRPPAVHGARASCLRRRRPTTARRRELIEALLYLRGGSAGPDELILDELPPGDELARDGPVAVARLRRVPADVVLSLAVRHPRASEHVSHRAAH